MNQTQLMEVGDFWQKVMAQVETSVLLPDGIERKFCAFDHNLKIKIDKATYTLTIVNTFTKYDQTITLEANSVAMLFDIIQKYFELAISE